VTYFLLECNGVAKGCAALEMASDSLGYLERLAVAPARQGRGLGRRLVEHAIGAAAEAGLVALSIGVIGEEVDLISWYEKLGFRRTTTRHFAHLPFEVCFLERRVA
jgi:ribosomal protein S18 acetylase RimI-like enzyme